MEGVTESVNARMMAVGANVLTEDGLLLRTCEHGIRHPVAHLEPHVMFDLTSPTIQRRHETRGDSSLPNPVACCGCCTMPDWIAACRSRCTS